MNQFFKYLFFLLSFFIVNQIFAIKAIPTPIKIKQPDGTEISVRLNGSEYFHYYTTLDGYPIVRDIGGYFRYAKQSIDGTFSSLGVRVSDIAKRRLSERNFVKEISRKINHSKLPVNSKVKVSVRKLKTFIQETTEIDFPSKGSPRTLVILVNFRDNSFSLTDPNTSFTNMLNHTGYSVNQATGSARDYFIASSFGNFSPQFDVVGPYTLPQNISYYGSNDFYGNDKNPYQMVIDACSLADKGGVDFSKYDLNNDGIIDNIFIYYAGYNEAEGANANTIWPHSSQIIPGDGYDGSVSSITFGGKQLRTYACTSELRNSSGNIMCGIGVFCHEFGHVLGLPDFYNTTNDYSYHTLGYWDIMDSGPYLNSEKTPPSYSAYERFYLGWITPVELKVTGHDTLYNIVNANQSYIVTQNANSNLDGDNPSPSEFFLLENRQNTGWDTYLPGHGMLVTHVVYNASDWTNNVVNNKSTAMGVDIIEADGTNSDDTEVGDTYPGTSNAMSLRFNLKDGTDTKKSLQNIKEINGLIVFDFISKSPTLIAQSNFSIFSCIWNEPSDIQNFTVYGENLLSDVNLSFANKKHFQMRKKGDATWSTSISLPITNYSLTSTPIEVRFNPIFPSYLTTYSDKIDIISSPATSLNIDVVGHSIPPVYWVSPLAHEAIHVTRKTFDANWKPVQGASGYYLDVYKSSDNSVVLSGIWVADTIYSVRNLVYSNSYYYKVRASDKTSLYENITDYSNTVQVSTLGWESPLAHEAKNIVYTSFDANWKPVDGATAYYLDVINSLDQLFLTNLLVTDTVYTVNNLIPDAEYSFRVRATDKSSSNENITDYSNSVEVRTKPYPSSTNLKIETQDVGSKTISLKIYLPNINYPLYIYNSKGACIRFVNPTTATFTVNNLPRHEVLILKCNLLKIKIIT